MKRSGILIQFFITAISLFYSLQSGAQMIEVIDYQGSGCPAGSLAAAISPNGMALSVIYDKFSAEARQEESPVVGMSCTINVKLNVPAGYRLASLKIDQRGFALLPEHSIGVLDTTVRTYGQNQRVAQFLGRQTTYGQGPYQDNFAISQVLNNRLKANHCEGGIQQMLVTTNMGLILKEESTEAAQAILDSTDIVLNDHNSSEMRIAFEKCSLRKPRK